MFIVKTILQSSLVMEMIPLQVNKKDLHMGSCYCGLMMSFYLVSLNFTLES